MGNIVSINISLKKGTKKKPVSQATIIEGFGIEQDAHAGNWHRQVSFLAIESIEKMREKGLNVGPGDFAENITTSGISLVDLKIGSQFTIGECLFEVTQIGKTCHDRCEIYKLTGDCIMPKEGIFAKVLKGGRIKVGDEIILC